MSSWQCGFIYKGVGGPKGPLPPVAVSSIPRGLNNKILDRGGFNNGADAHEENAILHNSAGCLWCHSDRVEKLLSMDRVRLKVLKCTGLFTSRLSPVTLRCGRVIGVMRLISHAICGNAINHGPTATCVFVLLCQ